MTLVLTTPITSGVKTELNDTIPPLTTKTTDIAPLYDGYSIKWLVDIRNTSNGKVLSQEIFATRNNTDVKHTRYGLIGDIIPHLIDVILNPIDNQLELEITNTTADSYEVSIIR